MKHPLLKLEPLIWLIFGLGILLGTILLTAWLLVIGLAAPLGLVESLDYEKSGALAGHLVGRLVLVALIVLPLWKGAHHTRHVFIDMGGAERDAVVAPLLYLVALGGSIAGIVAVLRL